eukprot:5447454-Alexandrium_andersonii.AAC.1
MQRTRVAGRARRRKGAVASGRQASPALSRVKPHGFGSSSLASLQSCRVRARAPRKRNLRGLLSFFLSRARHPAQRS